MRSMLVWFLVSNGVFVGATTVPLATGDSGACRPAELFIADDGSPMFEFEADTTIALNGVQVTGSTPLDGVFWSEALQQVTVERARQFHLCAPDPRAGSEDILHNAAEALRHQFDQQSVLTFDYRPDDSADAITITVPDIDITRFHHAFVTDPAAHRRLLGGSVSTEHTLLLVAAKDDLDLAHGLVDAAGGDWATATIAPGHREFAT